MGPKIALSFEASVVCDACKMVLMLPSKSKSRDAVNIDLVNNAFFVKCIKVLADNHTYSNP